MTKTAYIDFKAVKDVVDFRTVLSHYGIEPKGRGDQLKILCPFHDDDNPSCGVNTDKGVFNCFACGAGGDSIAFVAMMERLDPEADRNPAAHILADIIGFDAKPNADKTNKLQKPRPKPSAKWTKKEQAEQEPVAENKPLDLSAIRMELEPEHPFFESHNVPSETIEAFGLGYTNVGIMKGRVVIPIHNSVGDVVAFAGRYADEDIPEDVPRYKLPKNFHRGLELFNLHRAKIYQARHVVIVEGYWSAMRLHQKGIPTVATMGTSISDEQIALLADHGFRFPTVLFDGDEQGRKGALSVVERLSGANMYVRRLDLPDGIKPDSMSDDWLNRLRP